MRVNNDGIHREEAATALKVLQAVSADLSGNVVAKETVDEARYRVQQYIERSDWNED